GLESTERRDRIALRVDADRKNAEEKIKYHVQPPGGAAAGLGNSRPLLIVYYLGTSDQLSVSPNAANRGDAMPSKTTPNVMKQASSWLKTAPNRVVISRKCPHFHRNP